MSVNPLFPSFRTLVLAAIFSLTVSQLSAQTFTGRASMGEPPYSFEASLYPLISKPCTFKVSINNRTNGVVRIRIRNSKGVRVYDEYVQETMYRTTLDVSSLSTGSYTIDISKQKTHFVQEFSIEPAIRGSIVMNLVNPSMPDGPGYKILSRN